MDLCGGEREPVEGDRAALSQHRRAPVRVSSGPGTGKSRPALGQVRGRSQHSRGPAQPTSVLRTRPALVSAESRELRFSSTRGPGRHDASVLSLYK